MTKILLSILVFSVFSHAAVPPQKPSTLQSFQVTQRQIGGQAGAGFSLLNLQKIQAKNGRAERLIFEVGTKDGYVLKGLPGYFNAQNQVGPNRIVLDFSQMMKSKINEAFIKGILKDSKFITGVKLTSDPQDKTLSMILDLNTAVQMKTVQVAGKKQTAKVVLDIVSK